jgi:hypothetical protein
MGTQQNQLSGTNEGEDWVRQFTLSEEYLLRHHHQSAGGPYRRFESPNVIDLVRIRRQRARVSAGKP